MIDKMIRFSWILLFSYVTRARIALKYEDLFGIFRLQIPVAASVLRSMSG